MKIVDIQTAEVFIPLTRPFKTALRVVENVEDILVRVITDTGEVGYGEAPPTAVITGDTKASIVGAIRDFIRPNLIGMDIENLDGVMEKLHGCILKNTSAKAAVDMAIYDLYGKLHKTPLYKLLGGRKQEVETDLTISVNPVEEMVADSLSAVAEGYRVLKLKVGREGLADVARIEAIRKAVGPDIVLRVDANQGWNAKESVRIISAMEDRDLNIELVEQPVPYYDLEGMAYVTSRVYTPILADECVFSARDAMKIIDMGAADLLNIKLMKTGGIYEALRICAVAESFHVQCMVGCMLESKLAVSAGVHLAAARGIITKADLDGPGLCRIDPYVGGPVFDGGVIRMSDKPGLGIEEVPAVNWQ